VSGSGEVGVGPPRARASHESRNLGVARVCRNSAREGFTTHKRVPHRRIPEQIGCRHPCRWNLSVGGVYSESSGLVVRACVGADLEVLVGPFSGIAELKFRRACWERTKTGVRERSEERACRPCTVDRS